MAKLRVHLFTEGTSFSLALRGEKKELRYISFVYAKFFISSYDKRMLLVDDSVVPSAVSVLL